jgi:hypothetical protein
VHVPLVITIAIDCPRPLGRAALQRGSILLNAPRAECLNEPRTGYIRGERTELACCIKEDFYPVNGSADSRHMNTGDAYQQELRERAARQKHLSAIVKEATDAVVAAIADIAPRLHSNFFYGATGIHPRHLVTWYLFATDAELAEAKITGLTERIERLTRENLGQRGYPTESLSKVLVSFTTDEDIQRETRGNYLEYFK